MLEEFIIKTPKKYEKLRTKAEKQLNEKIMGLDIPADVKEIIHELQVYQIELEMQNEELKSTQLKLQKSQNKYIDLYNFAPTAFFTLDEKELVNNVNPAGAALLDIEKDNIIDTAFIRFVAPDSRHEFHEHIKQVISTKKNQKCYLNLLKDLKPVPVHMETDFYYNKDGDFKALLINASDISELKKIGEDLKHSNEWISFAQHSAKSGFWDWDMITEKLTWSNELYRLFGLSTTKEASFDTWLDLIHPDDKESAMDNLNQAIEQHEFLENEYRIIHPNGKEVWITALGSTVYDEDDKPQRMSGICLDISDRKKISEELLKSEEKYRDVLDNMMEGCQIIDADWRYIYVNDAAAKHGRISKEELLGHKMMDVYPGIEDTEMFATMKQCMDKRNPQHMVNEFFYPDNSGGWFELSIQPVPEGIFVLSIDITDRKMVEDSLKNSEKFLDTIIERSAHSLWISDENGTLIRQNQACRNLFHVSDQDVLGKYNIFNDNVIKEQGQMSRVNQVFEEGKTVNFSLIYDTSHIKQLELGDTVSLILEVTIAPVLDEKGSVINTIIQHVDITKREKAEEALIEAQNEKSKVLEILNEAQKIAKIGSWDWDMETNEVWWSDETYQIFGVTKDYEPSFESNKKFIHPDDLENYQKQFEHSFKTGAALDLDLRIIAKNGEVKNCYTPGKIIFHKSGKPKRFIGNIMDITERRKVDDEVKKSLIEKENLLKEIHHRVKNNMQIISSLLSLQTHYVDDDVVKVLEGSQKRVKSMALVHEKLYHSQSLSKIDMADYIQSLASDLFFSYLVKEGQIKLITEIENIEFDIETAIPCGLIINELVSNSLKHAFPNERKGKINISLKSKTDQYELIIMDDGIGLSKDFELKNIDSLGLQLVNSLTHQLDGDMEIYHNQGTKFIITFKESDYKKRIEE